jgi:tetratricopeptide (TPR) repeat protein
MPIHRRGSRAMNPRVLFIALLAVVSLVVSYLILPADEEGIAVLVRDGRNSEAVERLEFRRASGEVRPVVLAQLARAYEGAGNFARATELLQRYIFLRPSDADAFIILARLYEEQDMPDPMLDALARATDLAPTRERIARLAGLYRIHGRFSEELLLLQRMQGRPDLTADDLLRLAELLSVKGDVSAATTALLRADEQMPTDQVRGRIFLFEQLVAAGRSREAVERARIWLGVWRKPWLAVRLVRDLTHSASLDDLDLLATLAVRLHPETTLDLATILAESGRQPSAERLLVDWLASRGTPSSEDISGYFAASRALGDEAFLWRSFASIAANPAAGEAQALFAEALVDQFGDTAVAPVRARLSISALERRPLFAARLALSGNNPEAARRFLLPLDLKRMSYQDRRAWTRLIRVSSSDEIAFHILRDMWRRSILPGDLMGDLMALAATLGRQDEVILAMADLPKRHWRKK